MSKKNECLNLLLTKHSKNGSTKYLLSLPDGHTIESVILEHEFMTCACISSQVGCPLDCVFCATGGQIFERNLSVNEILAQVFKLNSEINKRGNKLDRILFMGMGEPLLNYESVVETISVLNKETVNGIPEILLATTGKNPSNIYELAHATPYVKLWLSLCVADIRLRAKLMPAASATTIDDLLDAGDFYAKKTGSDVRVGYLMIRGLTDSLNDAKNVIHLLHDRSLELQLFSLNEIPNSNLRGSPKKRIIEFAEFINSSGIVTTIFESKGRSIKAACGNLSARLKFT